MRRYFGLAVPAVAALAFLAAPAFAQDHETAAAAGGGSVRADIQAQIDEAEKKLTALAEAMPADKYGWRPGEKVRSVGEVFMHVAGGNYFLAHMLGAAKDESVNPAEFDKDANDKAKAIATMKASFEYVRKYLAGVSDADLDKPMKIFDHDGTAREMALVLATHSHEHLGQAIAYARMNGVVPPWSN